MNERIKAYLQQHFCSDYFNAYGETVWDDHYFMYLEDLKKFVELIRADEREVCAKVCEKYVGGNLMAMRIRARGEVK